MRNGIRAVIACVLLGPVAAAAQEMISPDQFLDIAEGRTLVMRAYPDGHLVGVEQFLTRETTVWKEAEHGCVFGEIATTDRTICFYYRQIRPEPWCWNVFREGDRLFVRSPELLNPDIQVVADINDAPVGCSDTPIS